RKQKCSLPFTSERIRIGAEGEGDGDDDDDEDEEEALIFQESPAPADRSTRSGRRTNDPMPARVLPTQPEFSPIPFAYDPMLQDRRRDAALLSTSPINS